jgi:hypothetical protein
MHPRYYLSPSQKVLWKKSPEEYIKKYIHDKEQFVTKEMKFGSKMATALEFDELTGDPILDIVMMELPKFECMDHVTEVDLKIGKEIVKLYGRMDSRKSDHSAFKEYKTGKNGKGGWTQKRVDEDPQITFYATMCFIINKKIPDDIELVWVITEDDTENPGCIVPTGEIRRFKTIRNMSQIINEMADMRAVWKEIGKACEKELI